MTESEKKKCRRRWWWRRVFQKAGTYRSFHSFQSLHICPIPFSGLAALVYVGNLSQSSHRVSSFCVATCWLVKYGVNSYRPRNKIDCYRISLHSSVAVE